MVFKIKNEFFPQYSAYLTAKFMLLNTENSSIPARQLSLVNELVKEYEKSYPLFIIDAHSPSEQRHYRAQRLCATNLVNQHPIEKIECSYSNNFKQIVNIGCGISGFEIENAMQGYHNDIKVFGYDLPETVKFITSAIARNPILQKTTEHLDNLKYAGVNLEKERLIDVLKNSGVDFNLPTKVVIVGVLPYISENKCNEILSDIGQNFGEGSKLIVSLNSLPDMSKMERKIPDKYKFLIKTEDIPEFFGNLKNYNILKSLDGNDGKFYLLSVKEKDINRYPNSSFTAGSKVQFTYSQPEKGSSLV